ncbi:MAG: hypothetical protein WKG07_25190 [Hymenobacter sp.]
MHLNPRYLFVPDDPALGQYREKFSNTPAALEEDAKGNQSQDASLGFSTKLVSTDKMLENLLEDNDNQVNQPAFARSRLFDMWIGDWDRHEDQWRWAQHKNEDGDKTYTAVPEDRDIAFFKGDGVLPSLISKKFAVRNFQNFGYDYGDYKGLNQTGLSNDRLYLSAVTREEWIKQANIMQAQLTDEVIEKAFPRQWPQQIYALHGAEIVAKLKSRRDLLPDRGRQIRRPAGRHRGGARLAEKREVYRDPPTRLPDAGAGGENQQAGQAEQGAVRPHLRPQNRRNSPLRHQRARRVRR